MAIHEQPEVVERARDAALAADQPLLLAVSGGVDSMALLEAMAEGAPERIAAVATFDHASGPHAKQAVEHVRGAARRLGLRFVSGRMPSDADRSNGVEAMWRKARHQFLRDTARAHGARVTTAHTRDDQVETVLLRVMRGAGARGLAALAAPGPIVRPFLTVTRAALEGYVAARGVVCVEDPSNARLDVLRNRVRHELLPALRRARPSIDEVLWAIGERSARWRAEVEAVVDRAIRHRVDDHGALIVAASELAGYDRGSLSVLWGALASRVGLALDRRGTARCAAFTARLPERGAIPLAGGWRLEAVRGDLVLQRVATVVTSEAVLPEAGAMTWGAFRFAVAEGAGGDEWCAELAGGANAVVRRWRAGDRLAPSRGQGRRRVTRYLSDARIAGSVRDGWPVVVQGDEVVWIPGVRRSDAATVRSGRPTRHYVCERAHG